MNPYVASATKLSDRILALIPANPSILQMNDAWDLFKVDGFKCDDLAPSLAQAGFALRDAQRRYKEQKTTE